MWPSSFDRVMSEDAGPRVRYDWTAKVALGLFIVAALLGAVAFFLPWWFRGSANGITQLSYLTEGCSDGRCVSFQPFPPLAAMFGWVEVLDLVGLALSLTAAGALILSPYRGLARNLTLLAGIGGAVLLAAAPMYLFFVLPATMSQYSPADVLSGFFGSCTPGPAVGCSSVESWGAGSGWYVGLAGSAVALVATVAAMRAIHRARATA